MPCLYSGGSKGESQVELTRKTLLGPRNKDGNILLGIPRSKKTQRDTDALADYLVEKFGSPAHRPLFLKVAWRLEPGTIDRLVGTSFELGANPRAYFIT